MGGLPQARCWAAIHTKARCEKVVAKHLRERNVPVFLPLITHRRRYGSRSRTSELPLFSGYVFYDYEALEREEVFGTRKVAGIHLPDDPEELREDLTNLAAALSRDPEVQRGEIGPPGTRVQVMEGPLRGTFGELVRRGPRTLLVLSVRFLGFSAEMTIDERIVRPLE